MSVRLSRSISSSDPALELPTLGMFDLPEKIVQFGTGAFLRGFVEYFIDEANRKGRFAGRVVAVSSTGSTRDAVLNQQDGLFTLAIHGVENGESRQRWRVVAALSRALSARHEWNEVLEVARDPNIGLVVSNTTEVGITDDPSDRLESSPPSSFPGKLARFLIERARTFGVDPRRGVIVLPCELIEDNGTKLREIVRRHLERWNVDEQIIEWVDTSVTFCNTLVDRIVPGAPSFAYDRRHGYQDDLVTTCEPYALFAIEGDEFLRDRLGFPGDDERIVVTPDIRPYRERKVRILNGAHTVLAPVALLAGFYQVGDPCQDEVIGRFVRRAVFDEIVPTVDAPDADRFARDVIDRFTNPFIEHALIDITLHATTKLRLRVVPSIVEFHARTGRVPASLAFGFASHLAFMRGTIQDERRAAGLSVPPDAEGEVIRAAWTPVDLTNDRSIFELARSVCADQSLWGTDFAAINGFADAVADHLVRIVRHGVASALDFHLTEAAPT